MPKTFEEIRDLYVELYNLIREHAQAEYQLNYGNFKDSRLTDDSLEEMHDKLTTQEDNFLRLIKALCDKDG
jgi:hypothetical protein